MYKCYWKYQITKTTNKLTNEQPSSHFFLTDPLLNIYLVRNRKIESLSTGGQIFSTSYVAITSFSELEWAWICAYMAHFCLGWQRIIQTTRSHCFLPKFVKFNMYNYSIIILYFFQKTSIVQKIFNFLNRPNIPILKNRFF